MTMAHVLDRPEKALRAESTEESLVRVKGLSKTFRRRGTDVHVLKDVDLDVRRGELLVLLGPSGCGKTTLLRCLVGLERPDRGRVQLAGTDVVDAGRGIFTPPNKRDVGMVFQNYALWPHMKVWRNVAYPLKARRMKKALASGRVEEVLEVVQCGHLADRYPPELSGGQQQRVSLARALAPRPSLLLMDEPLSNLDALLRVELRAQLRLLHRELGFTGVHVTHDQEEAIALGTRVAVMKEGRIEQVGVPVEVFQRPATEYVADFLGARNQLELAVEDGTAHVAGVPVRGLVRPGVTGSFHLRVRDAQLAVRHAGQPRGDGLVELPGGHVIEVLPGAEVAECVVEVGDARVFVAVPNEDLTFVAGDRVSLGLRPDKLLCYGADGNLVEDWAVCAAMPDPGTPGDAAAHDGASAQ